MQKLLLSLRSRLHLQPPAGTVCTVSARLSSSWLCARLNTRAPISVSSLTELAQMTAKSGGLLSFGSCPWPNESSYADLSSAVAASASSDLLLRVLSIAILSIGSAWLVRNTSLGRAWACKLVPCLQTMGAFALLGGLLTVVFGLPVGESVCTPASGDTAGVSRVSLAFCLPCRGRIPRLQGSGVLCRIGLWCTWGMGLRTMS